jgi:hypothetical protein
MDAGGISVVRSLPIDPAMANGMLLALRRDTPGSATGWSLGRRGSAEVDVDFFRTGAANPTWTSTARLWDPQAVAVVRAVVDLTVIEPDTCDGDRARHLRALDTAESPSVAVVVGPHAGAARPGPGRARRAGRGAPLARDPRRPAQPRVPLTRALTPDRSSSRD